MIIRGVAEAECAEDAADVAFQRLGAHAQPFADAALGAALGHQPQYLLLPVREFRQGGAGAMAAEQAGDDVRVDHALAVGDPAQRVRQHDDVENAALEEVARPPPGCCSSRRTA